MKVECEACGHLGAPAEILARPEGVVVVCAECGAESLMAASGPAPSAAPAQPAAVASAGGSTPDVEPQAGVTPPPEDIVAVDGEAAEEPPANPAPPIDASLVHTARQTITAVVASSGDDPVDSLVDQGIRIDPGSGPMRCPKCGYHQPLSTSCVRCGLGGEALGGTPAQWRGDVPSGKEAAADALDERWAALCEEGLERADSEAFLAYALAQGLVDRASRLVRLHAQDHFETPEGEAARQMLGRVIEKSHAVFLVSQGGGSRDVVVERTRQTMKALYIIVAILSLAALAAIFYWFTKSP